MTTMARANLERVLRAYDQRTLKRICEMDETSFGRYATRRKVGPAAPGEDYLYYRDNGSSILAVAHLDTVVARSRRTARFCQTEAGPVVHSGALDDRLGAYIILEMLPKLGVTTDLLLTVGEESGASTAGLFQPTKTYDWLIEFDRGGTDVVTYQYGSRDWDDAIRESGASVGHGSYSDISYLGHLGVKGANWGVGYHDYHGPRSHAYLNDTFLMLSRFLRFHEDQAGVSWPHTGTTYGRSSWQDWEDDDWQAWASPARKVKGSRAAMSWADDYAERELAELAAHAAQKDDARESVWDDTIPY